jgi:alpha-galactosidase
VKKIRFTGPERETTIFEEHDDDAHLRLLCGMACSLGDASTGLENMRGPTIVLSGSGFEDAGFASIERSFDAQSARMAWSTGGGALRLESEWSFCPRTGVVSRKDRLVNTGKTRVTISRLQARFAFPPGRYEVYAQDSRWRSENQGAWMRLHAGSLRFGCEKGRTTQGGTPYICLREVGSERADQGLAFHLLPCGNWSIEVTARTTKDGHSYAVVALGYADNDLRLTLTPGLSLECPEILIQALPEGKPERAAPRLHRWLAEHRFMADRPELPVVYNTWFDQFEVLEVPRLRRQLSAARDAGCEVFVVDAGWYGQGSGDWFAQAGDWREKTAGAFHGQMAAFADEVRKAGLGFGLWMEPERFGPEAPIRRENSDWFLPGEAAFSRIDLSIPAAYAYLRSEMSRLIETYRLAWMKVDFNFELGIDASGGELSAYYQAWYRLLDELRLEHPQTVFEGCASGGMRLDLASLSHFDGHFLSDTVNPVEVVRICQGALLRLPPGRLMKWATMRSAGRTIPRYTKSLATSPEAIVTPCGAVWEPSETADVDFILSSALPGVLGLSGDLAGLPEEVRVRLREHVEFFKRWRRLIRRSVAHLLTGPALKTDRKGWVGVQLSDSESAILFAYRLDDGSASRRFVLRQLDPGATYSLHWHTPAGREPGSAPGSELMSEGMEIELPGRFQAAVIVVTREQK